MTRPPSWRVAGLLVLVLFWQKFLSHPLFYHFLIVLHCFCFWLFYITVWCPSFASSTMEGEDMVSRCMTLDTHTLEQQQQQCRKVKKQKTLQQEYLLRLMCVYVSMRSPYLSRLLLTPTMTRFWLRWGWSAVYTATSHSEYDPDQFNIRILLCMWTHLLNDGEWDYIRSKVFLFVWNHPEPPRRDTLWGFP